MAAMNRMTGHDIEGIDEIEQSISEILDTVPGDRVMRAEYGSGLFFLVDGGMGPSGKARLAQATAEALRRFEPRVRITRVAFGGSPGEVVQTIYGAVPSMNKQITVRR